MTNELNERFSPMHVKQAIGIASDKRYAGGNMTGAVKAIEKMKKGLSDHPQVRAVLKRQNEDVNEKFDPADFDMVATDKDKAGAKMNIIMQLRKAADVRGNLPIKFADGKSAKLPPKVIELALKKFASFRKPDTKEKLQTAMSKSYKDMVHALKTMREEVELDEARRTPGHDQVTFKAVPHKDVDDFEKLIKSVGQFKMIIKGTPKGTDFIVSGPRASMDKLDKALRSNKRFSESVEIDTTPLTEGVDKAKIQKQIDQAEKYLKSFFGNTSSVKMKKFAIQKKIEKLKKQLNEAEEDYCDCGCECGKKICESCGKPHSPENLDESKMAGWVAIYNGKKVEIKKSEANDLYGAKMKAAKMLKVPKSKMGLLAIKPGYNEEVVQEARPPQIQKGKAKGSISATGIRGKGNKKFDVDINFDNGKFSFRITDESGKFQTVGIKQASKMLGEEVTNELMAEQNLQEAPSYKLHHNTFSGAVQEAIAVAKKQGYDVDEDDWSDKVATGPKKPSKDKTNRYSIKLTKNGKPTRKFLQIQVYNMGAKYELNCYVQ
jgi:hypothetical protein